MKRVVFLLFCASVIVIFWFISIDLLFYKYYYHISSSLWEQTSFFEFDIPVTIALLMIGSVFFYQKYYVKPIGEKPSNKVTHLGRLAVTKGRKKYFIDYQDIGLIYVENEMVLVQTTSGEKYYSQESLTSILNVLSSISFFRLNRQVIASRFVIKGYEKLAFQKLCVKLIEPINYKAPLVVSKYNAPSFKKWLTNSI